MQYAVLLQDAFSRVGAEMKVDQMDFGNMAPSSRLAPSTQSWRPTRPIPARPGLKQIVVHCGDREGRLELHLVQQPDGGRAARQRASPPSSRRARGRTRVARSRRSSRTRRASGCTNRRRSRASTSASGPRRCAPTATGRGWPTGGFRPPSDRRATRSACAHPVGGAAVPRRPTFSGGDRRLPRHDGHLRPRPSRAGRSGSGGMSRPGIPSRSARSGAGARPRPPRSAEQYVRWIANARTGNLGYSVHHHRPVRDVILEALPRTALLVGLALILSFALGIEQ